MIASILQLSRRDMKALGKNPDEYAVHKLVYSLFPGESRNFLYLDQGGDFEVRNILMVSEDEPQETGTGQLFTKAIPDRFLSYDRYAFEVRLNPVKRNDKKAQAVTGEKELKEWFISKQEMWGIHTDPLTLEISDTGLQRFSKAGYEILHNKATFRGVLSVRNRELFIESFRRGLGRGKAFGFGLLQLKPLETT